MNQKTIGEDEIKQMLMSQDTLREAAREKVEYVNKKFIIDKKRTDSIFNDIKSKEAQKEAIDNFQLGVYSDEYYESLGKENDEYLELASKAPHFLHHGFKDMVPFFAKNLILVGAKSGQGKSTLVSNIAFHTITQGKKILIVTNEERVTDVFNRITCLIKGWSYTNHSGFTAEQKATFREFYKKLGERVHIVSDHSSNSTGMTTTLEGIREILRKAHEGNEEYGAVLIDYFQNIKSSTEFTHLDEWKLLDKVGDLLEEYRLKLDFPIVLLAQLKMNADNDDFKYRIERAKSIYNRCTCAIEIIAQYDIGASDFVVHKSRFNSAIGKTVRCLFERGMYTYWDEPVVAEDKHQNFMTKVKEKNEKYK